MPSHQCGPPAWRRRDIGGQLANLASRTCPHLTPWVVDRIQALACECLAWCLAPHSRGPGEPRRVSFREAGAAGWPEDLSIWVGSAPGARRLCLSLPTVSRGDRIEHLPCGPLPFLCSHSGRAGGSSVPTQPGGEAGTFPPVSAARGSRAGIRER